MIIVLMFYILYVIKMVYNNSSLKNLNQTTHWMSKTRFYRIYSHIRNRCNRKENDNYLNYWWKLIKIERTSFESFRNEMYEDYLNLSNQIGEKKISIDRIDNNWNYNKENCRWIHINEQQSNRLINNYITYNWKTMNLRRRANELWIDESVLRSRIVTRKWDIERAFNTPVGNYFWNKSPVIILYEWKEYSVKELEKIVSYSRKTIYRKIKNWELATV